MCITVAVSDLPVYTFPVKRDEARDGLKSMISTRESGHILISVVDLEFL